MTTLYRAESSPSTSTRVKTILYMIFFLPWNLRFFDSINHIKDTTEELRAKLAFPSFHFLSAVRLIIEHSMPQDHPDDDEREYPDIKRNPLHEVTKTSYTLGILLGVFVGLLPQARFKNFNLYIIALSLFHFLEYYITAKYNPLKVHSESFLLNNGKSYMGAHSFAILECLIETVFCSCLLYTSRCV